MKQSLSIRKSSGLKLSYSIFLSAILLSLIVPAWGCKANESNQSEQTQTQTQETQQEQVQGTEIAKNTGENTQSAKKTGNTIVIISTSLGDIKIKLFDDKAPITVKNFLSYVNDGFFDGTIFHRVIRGFMIQGGGFTPDMQQKATKAPIKNEAANGIKNERGTIAMARTNVVDSATSQFFINLVNNTFLNHSSENFGYAVFGEVVEGFEVIDKIAVVKTGNVDQFQDVPREPVVIKSVKVVKAK